mmetsp:Transcript_123098/g.359414  ORF Transcript_123098/g.359414 Transcript_123098/m.359414 type:complete len:296 (-) Transcript_123098:635-1522(-)
MQHGVDLCAVAIWRHVPVRDDPKQLQLHPHAALRLVIEVEVVLRHLVLQDGQPLLLNVVDQLWQASNAGVEANLRVELLHGGRQHGLVDLKQGLLSGLHVAYSQVEALVHSGIAEIPSDRALLDLLVEVTHQAWRLLGLLVKEVDHVHILLELIACLLRLGEGPVLLAVVELLAAHGPDDHLAGHHGLLRAALQELRLHPAGLLVGVPLAVLLDAQLPDRAVGGDLLQPRSDVVAGLAAEGLLVLAQLPAHLCQHHRRVLVARVDFHTELQVLLRLVPDGVRPVSLRTPVQSLVV